MKAKSKTVPDLRFREFTDNWQHATLGNVASLISGQHLESEQYNDCEEGVPYFTGPSDFTNDPREFTKWTTCSTKTAIPDSILITVKGNGVGKLMYSNLPMVAMGRQLMAIRAESFSNSLLYQYLLTKTRQFVALASGNLIPGLSRPDILTFPIPVPSLHEQRKIADFLTAVDRRIEQLSQKKALLEAYKKGVMQQLFTQALRFKDEHGNQFPEWEEKTLGSIATFSKGCGISKADVHEGGILSCIRYGELYTHYSELIRDVKSRTNLLEKDLVLSQRNDVIIPASGETHIDIATASCVTLDGVALGGDLNIIRTKQNGIFLAYYLNNACKHAIAVMAQGSSVIHLYPDQLKRLRLHLPTLKEQTKIANFLTAFDRKIESVAQQITHTQSFKKGLLQQMFV